MNVQYDRIMVAAINAINASRGPVERHALATAISADIDALSLVLGRMVRSGLITRHHNANGTLAYSRVAGAVVLDHQSMAGMTVAEKLLRVISCSQHPMTAVDLADTLPQHHMMTIRAELKALVRMGELDATKGLHLDPRKMTYTIATSVPPCIGERYADNADPYLRNVE